MKTQGEHIMNRERFNQQVLFDGIGKGQMRMTDYDGVFEISNKWCILTEVKRVGNNMPYGQKLSYERVANAIQRGGMEALVIVTKHDTPSTEDVMLKDTQVTDFYINGEWHKDTKNRTYLQFIADYAKSRKINKLKHLYNGQ